MSAEPHACQPAPVRGEPPRGAVVHAQPRRGHKFAGKPVRFQLPAEEPAPSFKLRMPSMEERAELGNMRKEVKEEEEETTDPSKGVCYSEAEFEKVASIGTGNFSVVTLQRHVPTGELFAVKSVHIQEADGNSEVDVLSKPHRNVVKYYGHFLTPSHVHLVLEFMDAGSLDSLLPKGEPLPEPVIAAAVAQICVGLKCMHESKPGVIHRDIKPANILVNRRGEVKLSDFNTSRQLMHSMDKGNTFVGTVTYMAPERIKGERHSFPSDIWSLGMSLFELATGRYPFALEGNIDATSHLGFFRVMESVVSNPSPALDPDIFSAEFCDFLAHCLEKDSGERSTAAELLEHPFCVNAPTQEWLASWLEEHLPPPSYEL